MSVPLIGFPVSIAGVVTPPGLYEVDEPNGDFSPASFQYVPDASAFRSGTPPATTGPLLGRKQGSIGFRNHTLPAGYSKGVTWSEDLLFLEPEVECVNTNLTINFEISTSTGDIKGSAKVAHMFLTDRGGFVNLNTTCPDDPSINTTNTPDLKTRAYQAAWFTNGISMMFMDITDPTDKAKGTKAFERIDSELNQKWEIPVT